MGSGGTERAERGARAAAPPARAARATLTGGGPQADLPQELLVLGEVLVQGFLPDSPRVQRPSHRLQLLGVLQPPPAALHLCKAAPQRSAPQRSAPRWRHRHAPTWGSRGWALTGGDRLLRQLGQVLLLNLLEEFGRRPPSALGLPRRVLEILQAAPVAGTGTMGPGTGVHWCGSEQGSREVTRGEAVQLAGMERVRWARFQPWRPTPWPPSS